MKFTCIEAFSPFNNLEFHFILYRLDLIVFLIKKMKLKRFSIMFNKTVKSSFIYNILHFF